MIGHRMKILSRVRRFFSVPVAAIAGLVFFLMFLAPAFLHAQSPLTIQPSTGRVGIGTTNPSASLHIAGGKLHVGSGNTGGTGHLDANTFVLESTASNMGLTLLSNNTANGQIHFGDPQDSRVGTIRYSHPRT